MIAVPGGAPASASSATTADEAAVAVMDPTTTAVRAVPAMVLGVGDAVELGDPLGRAPVRPVDGHDRAVPVAREGRTSCPAHPFEN